MTYTLRFCLAALVCMTTACGEHGAEEVATSAVVPVSVESAHVETLERTVSVSGVVTASPGGELTITAPAAGRIAALPKAEGDTIRKGDLLARFDVPALAADVAARRAEADQARARASATRAAVARLSGLLDRGVASAREVEEARRDQAEADAAVAQADSAVAAATSLASRTEVHATFDGVVSKRWHQPGDFVDGAAGDPILRVINPRTVQIVAGVPLSDLTQIKIGQTAHVGGPGVAEPATAKVIARAAAVEPGQALADVRLAFAAPSSLPVGATVSVDIVLDGVAGALVVPRAAIVTSDNQTFAFVVGADNIAHRRPVTTGLASADRLQITKGLAANDRVVVQGQDGLPDGAAVTIAQ